MEMYLEIQLVIHYQQSVHLQLVDGIFTLGLITRRVRMLTNTCTIAHPVPRLQQPRTHLMINSHPLTQFTTHLAV